MKSINKLKFSQLDSEFSIDKKVDSNLDELMRTLDEKEINQIIGGSLVIPGVGVTCTILPGGKILCPKPLPKFPETI
ncbi:MAG: hypothetical protein ACRC2R_09460 [Xenococcaceae cyanobacterium]